ncbi:MAG TPA: universal stress protein [Candidatus Brocadiia bacterium]|nr:universal stress protein [Planctomycetota bacterium]MBI4007547.1 universal stress protein [Planctomycetota bacterium]MDO8094400.1 universal stress protein [Candidatus Brocadiales bacterium]
MYKSIYIPVDNSRYSNYAIDIGVTIAKKFDAKVVGSHVYAARLHNRRLKDMESGLPPQYQQEKVLHGLRALHGSLIERGLKAISFSYLEVLKKRCIEAKVSFDCKILEGKNYLELVKDIDDSNYDLVVMGVLGLGAVNGNLIGSVCERVVRRVKTDVLVIKNDRPLESKIMVAVDGSAPSNAAIFAAGNLARTFGTAIEAVSVFDPDFHRIAFENITNVLTQEAGQIFKFKEQEKLHGDVIDKGLAKVYQDYLDDSRQIIERNIGLKINTTLMEGKPYNEILKRIEEEDPSLLVIGRTGLHNADSLDIGSATENLLRLAPCHVLITSGNKKANLELEKKS